MTGLSPERMKMIQVLIPLVREFLSTHEWILNYVPDKHTRSWMQARFENFNRMDKQTREEYVKGVCTLNVTMDLGASWKPQYDEFWQRFGLWEFERSGTLTSADGQPAVSHYDFPREHVARGRKAVSIIHDTVLSRFPDYVLKPKSHQSVGMSIKGYLNSRAYLYRPKGGGKDVVWIEYDQHNLRLAGGFGRSDKDFYASYALPCWGIYKPHFANAHTYEHLQELIDNFCELLRLVKPYHQRFWEGYFGSTESC